MSEPDHITPVLERARAAFAAQFGGAPVWAAAAPGRVNLIGEHTDYNGGFVLPIAIDRVCVAVAAPASDPGITRVYSDDLSKRTMFDVRATLVVKRPETDGAPGVERGSWGAYVAGVFAQFQRDPLLAGVLRNLDVAIASSVPVGSGLSSSAAIEVATATLLEAAVGEGLEPTAKALLCQRAEHEFAGVPCGIMDQFISVLGRRGHALLIDCRARTAKAIPMPAEAAVVVIDTGVHHELAGGEYAKRKATCASAAAKLGVRELRGATIHEVGTKQGLLSPEELRCARHVVTETARAVAAADSLRSGDLAGMGRLMNESHCSLRDDYRVSCEELDAAVDAATQLPGVFGARMTGGGFGGCAIALTTRESGPGLVEQIAASYCRRFGRSCHVWTVTASEGARPIR